MSTRVQPRLDYIDVARSLRVLQNKTRHIPELLEMLSSDADKLSATRYSSLARTYESSALLMYALGQPLKQVRDFIGLAVDACKHVFRLRATDPPFPAIVLTYDPTLMPYHPDAARVEPMHLSGTKEYSLGHSQRCYHVACLALVAGNLDASRQVAAQAWDPPDAAYVGPGSFCTRNDQRLAYALKMFLAGDCEGAMESVSAIGPARGESRDVINQATIWRGLLLGQTSLFLEGLIALLNWHRRQATQEPAWNIEYFMCIVGLGLAALAVHRRLIRADELPQDDPFLPVEFLNFLPFNQ